MANLVDLIEEAAQGEEIEAVVIGEMGWGDYGSEAVPQYNEQPRGQVLSWKDAKPFLDYEYDPGYGAPGCNAVYVWTSLRVMFISQYDGATEIDFVPRNPTPVMPTMPGG